MKLKSAMPADDEKRSSDGLESLSECMNETNDSSKYGLRTSTKRRSSLFDDLPHSRSRNDYTSSSTLIHHHSQSTSVLNDSQLISNANPIRPTSPAREAVRQRPLFGAVMHRSEMLQPSVGRVSACNTSSNTENSSILDKTGNSVMSPTGKTVLGFVNNFGDSPFRFQSPQNQSLVRNKSPDPTILSQPRRLTPGRHGKNCSTQSGRYSMEHQDWVELSVLGDKLSCLDFSLCTTALIECNLNLGLRSVMTEDQAQRHLSYWIFPHASQNPVPASSSMCLENNTRSGGSWVRGSSPTNLSRSTTNELPSNLGRRLMNFVKGDKALLSRNNIGMIQRRGNSPMSMCWWRWQEAIRSIFLKWCSRITSLSNGGERGSVASDTYFYCLAKDHVAMFCVDETSDTDSKTKYEPRVTLSNIAAGFKKRLEQCGMVDIHYLDDQKLEAGQGGVSGENVSSAPMSPNLKSELEALRRAQAFGENAGADVRVKSDVRKLKMHSADCGETPCSIFGFDNVSCFFEVYLNTFGQMHTRQAQEQRLPFLVCDTIGPFLHATLETLKSRPIRTMGTEAVRLEGLILPSAFRSLVGIVTSEVVKRDNYPQCDSTAVEGNKDDGYLIIETALSEEQSPIASKLQDSSALNGWNAIKNNESANNKIAQCAKGRRIKRLVWEARNPQVLVCNFE